jgi:small subunit ribosomal protein S8
MIVSDPIADMLTRIRNANVAGHDTVAMPMSKLRQAVAEILVAEGYVDGWDIRDQTDEERRKKDLGGQQLIELNLRYTEDRERAITGLTRVSKPGLRVYAKSKELPRVMGGLGIAIISTSNGVMSDRQARQAKVGGEVLCYVW